MLRLNVGDPVHLRVHHVQPLYKNLPQIPQLVNLLPFRLELRLVLQEQHPDLRALLLVRPVSRADLRDQYHVHQDRLQNHQDRYPVHRDSRADLQDRYPVHLASRPDHQEVRFQSRQTSLQANRLLVQVEGRRRIISQVIRTSR